MPIPYKISIHHRNIIHTSACTPYIRYGPIAGAHVPKHGVYVRQVEEISVVGCVALIYLAFVRKERLLFKPKIEVDSAVNLYAEK